MSIHINPLILSVSAGVFHIRVVGSHPHTVNFRLFLFLSFASSSPLQSSLWRGFLPGTVHGTVHDGNLESSAFPTPYRRLLWSKRDRHVRGTSLPTCSQLLLSGPDATPGKSEGKREERNEFPSTQSSNFSTQLEKNERWMALESLNFGRFRANGSLPR